MNKVFNEDLTPVQAIIVFKQGKFANDYYLESREIVQQEKGYQMSAGSPLTKKTISKIMLAVETDSLDHFRCPTIFPKNLLYFEMRNLEPYIVWQMESQIHELFFSKNLNIRDGKCHLPSLIFKYANKKVYVYAVKTNNASAETSLYHAPFHNVFKDGSVCMGSAKFKKSKDIIELMKNIEVAFFKSKFSHLHGNGSPIEGNLNTYLSRLIKTGAKFDNKKLVSSGDYLNDLL